MVSVSELFTSFKETIQNLGVISIISIITIIIILIALMVVEKKLREKIVTNKNKNRLYIDEVNKINLSNPQETLKKIDYFARMFFKERFKMKRSSAYSELNDLIQKQKNKKNFNPKKISKFCDAMTDLLYSGRKTDKALNQQLISQLIEIIKENPIEEKVNKYKFLKKSKDVEVSRVNQKDLQTK